MKKTCCRQGFSISAGVVAALMLCLLLVASAETVADERLVVFGEYPVVEELKKGRFGEESAGSTHTPLIEYARGADYREKARIEALHLLNANVYGYTFYYKPGSVLMKTEEVFRLELRGTVPEGAVIEVVDGVVNNVYRIKLGLDLTPSIRSWRSAFKSNTIRLVDAEGTSDFFMGWEGRSDAYLDALENLVLGSARIALSSKPLVLKGDILVEGNPSFAVGAGRYYCRLRGYVNFLEVVTYD